MTDATEHQADYLSDPMQAARMGLVLALRQAGVTNVDVIRAIESIPREIFVPEPLRHQAYADAALPIGVDQTISQPSVVARMTQALEIGDRMKVLEIGTGSGYQGAVLSRLCRRLYTIERHKPLLKQAEARFEELRLKNVTTLLGDGTKGWPDQAPFDRIIVTAAFADVPAHLIEQLTPDGIMVVPVDDYIDGHQRLIKLVRTPEGAETEDLGETRFVPMVDGLGRDS